MLRSSSSYTAHTFNESRHTAAILGNPHWNPRRILQSMKRVAEDPLIFLVLHMHQHLLSPPTRRGPLFRQTIRIRVISPTRVTLGSRPQKNPVREMRPHPSLPVIYHLGGPSSSDLMSPHG
nr:hypothetical protein [Tanacetum cinerariifolium]